MIFHVPWAVREDWPSATEIRPRRLLEAFRAGGFDVSVVMGDAPTRKRQIEEIENAVKKGKKFAFCYSESATLPTFLANGKKDLAQCLGLDFAFFSRLKARGTPIGLFYRDIYWMFPGLADSYGRVKATALHALYRYDLRQYKKFVDVLFLPSTRMVSYLGQNLPFRIEALPSGMDRAPAAASPNSGPLTLFYVGGLGLHYNMRALFSAVAQLPNIRLELCCRESEWAEAKTLYAGLLGSNVRIHHASGPALKELYASADVCSLIVEPSEYRDFAMPMKLFEYLGNGKPVLATEGSAAADFVDANGVGWAIKYDEAAIRDLLASLSTDRHELGAKSANIANLRSHHSWEARTRFIASKLAR